MFAGLVMALAAGALAGAPSRAQADAPQRPPLPVGKAVFDKWCSDCHRPETGPGSMALQRKYKGQIPAVLEQRGDLAPALVTFAVRNGVSFMPSFRKTEISDGELEQLGDYLSDGKRRKHQAGPRRRILPRSGLSG